jgi:S1-C subfamily serine protease
MSRPAAAAGLVITLALGGCGGGAAPTAPVPPALLAVTVTDPSGARSIATAFAAGDGRAVTVAHAIAGSHAVLVAAPGGPARRARVVATNRRLDLAVLAVPGLKAPVMSVASPRANQAARVIVVRGSRSRSLQATVRRLITARVRDDPGAVARVRPALELDAAVSQGDSGAPVLDAKGRIIGMVFAQASYRDDRTYALDARAVRSGGR